MTYLVKAKLLKSLKYILVTSSPSGCCCVTIFKCQVSPFSCVHYLLSPFSAKLGLKLFAVVNGNL